MILITHSIKTKKNLTSNNCPETLAYTVQQYHKFFFFFFYNTWEINRFHIDYAVADSCQRPCTADVARVRYLSDSCTSVPHIAILMLRLPFACTYFFSISLYLITANNIESKNVHGLRHNKITKWHDYFHSEA